MVAWDGLTPVAPVRDGNPGPDAQKEPAGEGRWPAVQVMTFFSDVEPRGGGTLVSLLLLSLPATRLSYR